MYQGKLNKARRGELLGTPPIGYVRLLSGEWAIDPDEEVRAVARLVFDQFDREATTHGLLRYLVRHHVRIPVRAAGGPSKTGGDSTGTGSSGWSGPGTRPIAPGGSTTRSTRRTAWWPGSWSGRGSRGWPRGRGWTRSSPGSGPSSRGT